MLISALWACLLFFGIDISSPLYCPGDPVISGDLVHRPKKFEISWRYQFCGMAAAGGKSPVCLALHAMDAEI